MNDTEQLVKTRSLSWEEMVRKAWGKDYLKPDTAYEFGNNRKFEDARVGGPYDPEHFED